VYLSRQKAGESGAYEPVSVLPASISERPGKNQRNGKAEDDDSDNVFITPDGASKAGEKIDAA